MTRRSKVGGKRKGAGRPRAAAAFDRALATPTEPPAT